MPSPRFEENVPLASWTTLAVGGPARFFVEAHDEAQLRDAVHFARDGGHPLLVLGGGSNLLVSDRGFAGLVVRLVNDERTARVSQETVALTVGAGHDWDTLVRGAVERDWAGIECLSGIPGRVGAAPMQNIGAYGQEIRETLRRIWALDTRNGELEELAAEDCGFAYRWSHFKGAWKDRYVILRVELALRPGGDATVRYPELERRLREASPRGSSALVTVREAVLAIRRGKSMVLDGSDPNRRSAGSFFTNPVVEPSVADTVAALADRREAGSGDAMPRFAQDDGRVKLSAAWLIDHAGFHRGHGEGPAGLSTRHVLALVNRGGARATDLVRLATSVRSGVEQTFGIRLAVEPALVGFDPEETMGLTA